MPAGASSWARLGLGTVWAGREWPPGNKRYERPRASQLDGQIRTALSLIGDGEQLVLDTAVGYGDAQERLAEWLRDPANAAAAARCVVATKFGEVFDKQSGRTMVDLSAAAASVQLAESIELLGRVDIFYSHVTSQISPEQAAAV
jgi:aryl-alcohol dehydrogenase-like predicted oxidoreductase